MASSVQGKLVFPKTAPEVEDLAEALTAFQRDEPVVVVACHERPDSQAAGRLRSAAGVDVYFLCNATLAQEFAAALPESCAVYAARGKAAVRVYPPGIDWMDSPRQSRFTIVDEENLATAHSFVVNEIAVARERFDASLGRDPEPLTSSLSDENQQALQALKFEVDAGDPLDDTGAANPDVHQGMVDADGEVRRLEAELSAQRDISEALRREVEAARAKVRELEKHAANCRCQVVEEAGSVSEAIRELEEKAAFAEAQARDAVSHLTKVKGQWQHVVQKKPLLAWLDGTQAGEEQLVRALMKAHWQSRFDPDAQDRYPLRDFSIGPRFFERVGQVHGVDRQKLVHLMVEFVSGRASKEKTAEFHEYREGEGGENPAVIDPELGTLMRAYLKKNTAAAHRLHFWQGSNGHITFESVAVHDAPAL